MSKILSVGDVISSERFKYGTYSYSSDKSIGTPISSYAREEKTHEYEECLSEEERVKIAAKTGKVPPKFVSKKIPGGFDAERANYKYVVISANMQGGGTGHGPGDVYPDGLFIVAQRLTANDKFDPNGEKIHFYVSGCFNNQLDMEDITVHKKLKMKQSFSFE